MSIPESFITEVSERNDIESVVSEYVALTKRTGSNKFGLCPFHGEKTPSFSVNSSRQMYYCFGCHKGGGVINFIMEIENIGYVDAIKKLADRAGLQMPEDDDPNARRRARLLDLNKDAARFFYSCLVSEKGKPAREYIAKRKLENATVKNFGLGYAPGGWQNLRDAMHAKGYTDEELYAADLVKQGKNGSYYDSFRNRLMFPVIDVSGHVIGFSGRILGDGEPKYLNSRNTPVFDKGRNLFGLNFAKKSKSGCILLVEGNIDVVTLHQAGFDSAVASLGTALTEQQAQLISRYVDRVIIAYDSDSAGRDATTRALKLFSRLDVKVQVLRWDGDTKDPDEFIKANGTEAFRKLLEASENQMEYKLRLVEEKYNLSLPEQKAEYLTETERIIAALPGKAQREVYARSIAARLSIGPDAVISDVEKQRASLIRRGEAREQRELVTRRSNRRYDDPTSAAAEEGIIKLLMKDPALIDSELLPESGLFSDERLRAIYEELTVRLREGRQISPDLLAATLTSECISIMAELADSPTNITNAKTTLKEYVDILNRKKLVGFANIDALLAAKRQQ